MHGAPHARELQSGSSATPEAANEPDVRPQRACSIQRWVRGRDVEIVTDETATEEPLEIRLRGRPFAVTMRTPGHDDELTAGLLLSESIISSRNDIVRIDTCARNEHDNAVAVTLAPEVSVDFKRVNRHLPANSSCGVCGKSSIESVHQAFAPIESSMRMDASVLITAPTRLRELQSTFTRTGGLHAAALLDETGAVITVREDIGRHNAVDKVIGHALLTDRLPLDRYVLLVSGRASFEILQKALSARIAIIAAVSAPSSLAVQFAAESGQTLIGFLREDRMNLYTRPDRIRFDQPPC